MNIRTDSAQRNDSFKISLFRGVHTSSAPEPTTLSRDDFIKMLENATHAHKLQLPMWNGCMYKQVGAAISKNASGCSVIVGDVDETDISPLEMFKRLKELGLDFILETSSTHMSRYKPYSEKEGGIVKYKHKTCEPSQKYHIICKVEPFTSNETYEALVARLNGLTGGALGTDNNQYFRRYFYGVDSKNESERLVLDNRGLALDDSLWDVYGIVPIPIKTKKDNKTPDLFQSKNKTKPAKKAGLDEARVPLNESTRRFVEDALENISPAVGYEDAWISVSCALYHMSTAKDGDAATGREVWFKWSRSCGTWTDKLGNVKEPITDYEKWDSGDLKRDGDGEKLGWTYIADLAKDANPSFDAESIINGRLKANADDLMDEVEADDFDEEFAPAAEKPWTDKLQRNAAGNRNLKPAMGNVDLILRNDKAFAGCFAFNEFTNEFCIVKTTSLFKKGDAFDDDIIVAKIKTHCSSNPKYRVDFKNTDIALKVAEIAKENKFHPVRDYLNSLVWDGTPRIDELFVKYCGCKNDSYHREAARLWLVAAVARVFEAGHKFDYCPVLSGKQGIGKSSFARILAKDWFVELQDDLKDKKAALEKTEGAWIVELSELASLNHRNVNHVKGFLTDTDNKYRKAYARRAQNNPIQCVYFGSTNENSYLIDKTGNRRFWPVAVNVEQIDLARLAAERDSLWAEALREYKKMRDEQPSGSLPLFLGKEANATAIELQEGARIESDADVIADAIIAYFSAEEGFDNPMPESINTVWVWCNILNLTGQPAGKTRRDILDALDKLVGLGKIAKRDRLKRHPVLM